MSSVGGGVNDDKDDETTSWGGVKALPFSSRMVFFISTGDNSSSIWRLPGAASDRSAATTKLT